jgi:hypothetical protein
MQQPHGHAAANWCVGLTIVAAGRETTGIGGEAVHRVLPRGIEQRRASSKGGHWSKA